MSTCPYRSSIHPCTFQLLLCFLPTWVNTIVPWLEAFILGGADSADIRDPISTFGAAREATDATASAVSASHRSSVGRKKI